VDDVLANSLALIRALAATPTTMIATPIVLEPDYRALANSVGILDKIKASGAFKAGTAGAEDIPELAAFGDRITYVKGKVGFNAFSSTLLDRVLKERGIKDVLIAGMATALCIDSTGRAAYERGYSVKILSDCTSARTRAEQEFFCQNIFPLYGGVLDSRQVLAQLDAVAA
jgi:nicotinamidase-related amidase